jgi:hypothetical protein
MRVLVGKGDSLRTRENGLQMVLTVSHPTKDFMFRLDGFGGGELAAWSALWSI